MVNILFFAQELDLIFKTVWKVAMERKLNKDNFQVSFYCKINGQLGDLFKYGQID